MAWNRPIEEDDKYWDNGVFKPNTFKHDLNKYIDYLECRPSAGQIINCKTMNRFGKWVHLGEVLELYKKEE